MDTILLVLIVALFSYSVYKIYSKEVTEIEPRSGSGNSDENVDTDPQKN